MIYVAYVPHKINFLLLTKSLEMFVDQNPLGKTWHNNNILVNFQHRPNPYRTAHQHRNVYCNRRVLDYRKKKLNLYESTCLVKKKANKHTFHLIPLLCIKKREEAILQQTVLTPFLVVNEGKIMTKYVSENRDKIRICFNIKRICNYA